MPEALTTDRTERRQKSGSMKNSHKGSFEAPKKSSRGGTSSTSTSPLPPQQTTMVRETAFSPMPTRVVGWKTSKNFSKTTSSIEIPPQPPSRPPQPSTSRPAAIRIQMIEPVGPSAYSLSLQAKRSPSEQWKVLKNRLMRKKSSEDPILPEIIDKVRLSLKAQKSNEQDGVVVKTNELKVLLKGSESSENTTDVQVPPTITASLPTEPPANSNVSSNVTPPHCSSSSSSDRSPKFSGDRMETTTTEATATITRQDSNVEGNPSVSTVKWDESNTLDASVLGDAIEAFLKGLKTSSGHQKSSEKRVSFR